LCAALGTELDVGWERRPAPQGDGVYGRFDADLDAAVAAGVALGSIEPAPALRATVHHYSTAGVYVGTVLPLAATSEDSLLSFGVDLRPTFLPRWSENLQQGPARLDLALDSISLAIGPYFRFAEHGESRGLETSLGLGVPLLSSASGPFIEARGVAHFPDGAEPTRFAALVLLAWHHPFVSPWLGDSAHTR
jgi:hypothetical protein